MNHQPFNTNQNVAPEESACVYRVLRYTPNLVRDEWVNIGILLFNPYTGERRLRIIEEEDEYRRVRRLHPRADEELLRGLSEDLEDRFQIATSPSGNGSGDWQQTLAKLDESLSNALQLAPQKGVVSTDIDTEMERLYADHVTPPPGFHQRGRTQQPSPDALLLFPSFPPGAVVGASRKISPRRTLDSTRRPLANRLQLSPQRHVGLRPHPVGHALTQRF